MKTPLIQKFELWKIFNFLKQAIVDMVLNIGESIDYLVKNGSSNDLAQFYYEYSQLVSNFAEKSV
jgi:hypothetical protein